DAGSRLLIEYIKVDEDDVCLDLGCGYGYVGIVIGKSFPGNMITFVDINQRAIDLTNVNAMRNFLGNKRIYDLDFLDEKQRADISGEKYGYVLFNPPIKVGKKIMEQMFLISLEMLDAKGKLYTVIKTSLGAKSWQIWFEERPSVELSVFKKGGYRVFAVNK
ncbi:MAG: class I SAM-dependent methyltransferase, partial [Candidatus Hodarchaeota archaeon]